MTDSPQNRHPSFDTVFSEAVARAVREGLIDSVSDTSRVKSYSDDTFFHLKSPERGLVASYPKQEIYEAIAASGRLDPYEASLQAHQVRSKAIEWAKSVGYSVPSKPDGCLSVLMVSLGLLLAIIPGILVMIWIWLQNRNYESEVNKIVGRWNDAGRPEPGTEESPPLPLERIIENNIETQDLESKLIELEALKSKGLISEGEYGEMRRKLLGI